MRASFTIGLVGLGGAGSALAVELCLRGAGQLVFHDADGRVAAAFAREGGIRYDGLHGRGIAKGLRCAASLAELVGEADCLVITVTADQHTAVAHAIAAHIRPHQLVILHTGYVGGCRLFVEALRHGGCAELPVVAETVNTLHLSAAPGPCEVYIKGRKRWLEVAGCTPDATRHAIALLGGAIPALTAGGSSLENGLNNPNPIGHLPAMLGNLGLLGRQLGQVTHGSLQFDELSSDAVRALSLALDRERLELMNTLGLRGVPVSDFVRRAYGPADRLPPPWPRFGSKLLPRFLHEDVAAACVPMEALGVWCGARTPLLSSLLHIVEAATSHDWRATGRTLEALGEAWVESECKRSRSHVHC